MLTYMRYISEWVKRRIKAGIRAILRLKLNRSEVVMNGKFEAV